MNDAQRSDCLRSGRYTYYLHPTLNHVSLSLDVNECEEIDNTVGMLHGHMFRK